MECRIAHSRKNELGEHEGGEDEDGASQHGGEADGFGFEEFVQENLKGGEKGGSGEFVDFGNVGVGRCGSSSAEGVGEEGVAFIVGGGGGDGRSVVDRTSCVWDGVFGVFLGECDGRRAMAGLESGCSDGGGQRCRQEGDVSDVHDWGGVNQDLTEMTYTIIVTSDASRTRTRRSKDRQMGGDLKDTSIMMFDALKNYGCYYYSYAHFWINK